MISIKNADEIFNKYLRSILKILGGSFFELIIAFLALKWLLLIITKYLEGAWLTIAILVFMAFTIALTIILLQRSSKMRERLDWISKKLNKEIRDCFANNRFGGKR